MASLNSHVSPSDESFSDCCAPLDNDTRKRACSSDPVREPQGSVDLNEERKRARLAHVQGNVVRVKGGVSLLLRENELSRSAPVPVRRTRPAAALHPSGLADAQPSLQQCGSDDKLESSASAQALDPAACGGASGASGAERAGEGSTAPADVDSVSGALIDTSELLDRIRHVESAEVTVGEVVLLFFEQDVGAHMRQFVNGESARMHACEWQGGVT